MHPAAPDFVRHSDRGRSTFGLDLTAPMVLEVTETWGDLVLETVHLPPRSPALKVGTERFPLTDVALPFTRDHVLFRWRRDRWEAVLEPDWDVSAEVDGARLSLDDLVARHAAQRDLDTVRIPLSPGMRLEVHAGEVVFHAHLVRRAAYLDTRGSEEDDWSFPAIFSLVGFIGLLFGVIVWSAPPPPTNTVAEVPDEIWAVVMQEPEPDDPPAPTIGDGGMDEAEESADDAGEAPKDDSADKVAGGTSEGTPDDAEVVSRAGLFAAWDDAGIDAMEGTGLSIDRIGEVDAGPSSRRAGPGWALEKGSGNCGHAFCTGADGSGYGDDMGTRGPGTGDDGYGGPPELERTPEPGIEVFDDQVITLGCMDRSLVDQVVKTHLPRIRYCYQRMLPRDPTLAGKVTVRFTIANDGSVSSSTIKFTSLNHDAVEECVQERFFSMQFPRPKGCSQVIVSYPFLFSPK